MLRSAMAGWVRSLLVVLALAAVTSCAGVDTSGWIKECDHSLPERGKWVNHLYPGAQKVEQKQHPSGALIATFETRDEPDLVLAYYERVLKSAGWKHANHDILDYDIGFTIKNCCYFGTASVRAERSSESASVTIVEVYSAWNMGCG